MAASSADRGNHQWPRICVTLLWSICAACASPRLLTQSELGAPAPIVTPAGQVAERSVPRLLDRQLGTGEDPKLLALVEAFRQQAQSPLVTGNRVQLLIDGP